MTDATRIPIDDELLKYIHLSGASALDETSGELVALTATELRSQTIELTRGSIPLLTETAVKVLGVSKDAFEHVEILVVPSFRFHAEAIRSDGKTIILLYRGLQYCLSFAVEVELLWIRVHNLALEASLKERAIHEIIALGEEMFLSYIAVPYPLPSLRKFLASEEMIRREGTALITMELFVILHELGHVRLAHLEGHQEGLRLIPTQFRIDEPSNRFKEQELEADRFAINSFSEEVRASVMASVCQFLIKLSIFESFLAPKSPDHPYAINRMNHLLSSLPNEIQASLTGVVDSALKDHAFGLEFQSVHRNYINSLDPSDSSARLHRLLRALLPIDN